jgi:hypothetical protein
MRNGFAMMPVSISLLIVSLSILGQDIAKRTVVRKLDTTVGDFTLNAKSIFDGVQMLNGENPGLDFGFEDVLAGKVSDPATPYTQITIQLKKPTTREVLDALCAADPRYTWSVDGLTVNIFPRATITDSKYLLNRKLAEFRVDRITDVDQGLLGIARQLPGPLEQIAHSQIGGDCSYPTDPWSASFEELTVRQAINRLVEHMGQSSLWVFGGSDEFRYFAFYKNAQFHSVK